MVQRRKKNTKKKKQNKKALTLSVVLFTFLTFLFVIFKDKMGIIGEYYSKGVFIVFGLTAYIAPIILLVYFYQIQRKNINTSNRAKYIMSFVIYLNVLLLLALYFDQGETYSDRISNSYNQALNYTGAGFIGTNLYILISMLLGNIGIYVLSFMVLVATYFVFSSDSLGDLFRRIGAFFANSFKKVKNKYQQKKLERDFEYIEAEEDQIKASPVKESSEDTNMPHINFHQDKVEDQEDKDIKVKEDTIGQIGLDIEDDDFVYNKPPLELLKTPPKAKTSESSDRINRNGRIIEETLRSFGINSKVVNINSGPTVTSYEVKPESGIKVSKILNLSNDLSLSLATSGIRIEAPIPGKPYVGIEVPNQNKDMVYLKDLFFSEDFLQEDDDITVALGRNLFGKPVYAKLNDMPHLLVAGATGSGKSVCINTIIMSILYKYSPVDVEFILIDPKMVELKVYEPIPHLAGRKVVTSPDKASEALEYAVATMEERFRKFAKTKCRDIESYNQYAKENGLKKMPYLLVIIDELSDLMITAPKEVENFITRLAQMGRASGIHLIIATQRPSSDVITGVIKANIPSRISFQVASSIDSRVILDLSGAEKLMGMGDMLYYPAKFAKPMRVQGAFVSDKEIEAVVGYLEGQDLVYVDEDFNKELENGGQPVAFKEISDPDEYLEEAIDFVVKNQQASVSGIQRRFSIGYPRAGRIVDQMQELGIVGPQQGSKPRDVLVDENFSINDSQADNLLDPDKLMDEEQYYDLYNEKMDELLKPAAKFMRSTGQESIIALQDEFDIDYQRASKIKSQLVKVGVIRPKEDLPGEKRG